MLVRRIARPMLATAFVTGGADAFRRPAERARLAEPVVDLVAEAAQPAAQKVAAAGAEAVDSATGAAEAAASRIADTVRQVTDSVVEADLPGAVATQTAERASDQADAASQRIDEAASAARGIVHDVARGRPLPFETETYVRANAAVQVGAGLLLASGRLPRLSSAALAATLVPTTFAGHRFWEVEGTERRTQQAHFMKNVSLLGGLILAAVDTEGRPGLAYRTRHARKEAKLAARAATANAALGRRALRANAKAARRLAGAHAATAGTTGRRRAASAVRRARKDAEALGRATAGGADGLAKVAASRMAEVSEAASARGHELLGSAHSVATDLSPKVRELGARAHGALPLV